MIIVWCCVFINVKDIKERERERDEQISRFRKWNPYSSVSSIFIFWTICSMYQTAINQKILSLFHCLCRKSTQPPLPQKINKHIKAKNNSKGSPSTSAMPHGWSLQHHLQWYQFQMILQVHPIFLTFFLSFDPNCLMTWKAFLWLELPPAP